MKLALIMAAVLLCPAIAVADPTKPSVDTAVADASRVVDAFHAALENGDRQAVETALDDNVQIYEQGYAERSRSEYASHHLASDMAFAGAVKQQRTSRSGFVSGDLAYVVSEHRSKGKFKDKDVDPIGLETMVLRRSAGGWKIVHIHWSSRKAQ